MRVRTVVDGLVAACLVLLVAAPLAVSAATPEPTPVAPSAAGLPEPAIAAGGVPELTPLPAFGTPEGQESARRAVREPEHLPALVQQGFEAVTGVPQAPRDLLIVPPSLDLELNLVEVPVAPGREQAGLDLAGLLLTADAHGLLTGGSEAARSVLAQLSPRRCPVALTRLFASVAGRPTTEPPVEELAAAAARACPGDVTPTVLELVWLVDALPDEPSTADAVEAFGARQPVLAAVLTGDRLLAQATAPDLAAPFRSRRLAQQALQQYEAAAPALPDADLGAAEALRVLGQHDEAVERLRGLVERVPGSRLAVERLAEAELRTGGAARATALLADVPAGDPSRLFPGDPTTDDDGAPSMLGSVALGLLGTVPARLDRSLGGFSATGATVQDYSFVPQWRAVPGMAGSVSGCAAQQLARAELAAGRVVQAAQALGRADCALRPARLERVLAELTGRDRAAADAAALEDAQSNAVGGLPPAFELPHPLDDLQELQRYAGDLDGALATARRWAAASPGDWVPVLRQAEVAFLREQWGKATARASEAARLAPGPVERGSALLVAGAAQGAAGQDERALRTLDEAEGALAPTVDEALAEAARLEAELAADEASGVVEDVVVDEAPEVFDENAFDDDDELARAEREQAATLRAGYALFEVRLAAGNLLLRAERFGEAERSFLGAREAFSTLGDLYVVAGARPELADVGQALAALGDGRPEEGLEAARSAVASDPDNPLFQLDLAFVERRTGDVAAAERSLRKAREADPRLGVAALDLGTMLAEQGRDEEAEEVLLEAVALEPTSAPGWHTLGVVLQRGSARDVLQAQAAFARAAQVDKDFRGRERVPVYDDRIYVSRLDLSKPLPPEWSFSTTEQRLPATALAVAVLLGLFGWLRGKYVGKAVGIVEGRARSALERTRRVPAYLAPAVAVVGTFFVLLLPVVRADLPVVETAALAGGVALLLLALVQVRRRFATAPVRHIAWTPALVVGVAGAASGLGGYAPVPAAQGTAGDPRVHRAGPLLLFGTGMLLLAVATLTEVPAARVLATSALGMAAVCLTPAGPFDGPHVAAPRMMRVMAVLGTAVALGLAFGIL